MNNIAFIIGYINHKTNKVKDDFEHPVYYAVQTIRHYHPDAKLYIMNYDNSNLDWSDIEADNVFEMETLPVFKIEEQFKRFGKKRFCEFGINQILDIPKMHSLIEENLLCYVDADIFWTDAIDVNIGIDLTLFNCHPNNTGCWFYDKRADKALLFIDHWIKSLERTMEDENYFNFVLNEFEKLHNRKFEVIDQERPYFVVRNENQNLCSQLGFEDYYNVLLPRRLKSDAIVKMKNLHLMHNWFTTNNDQLNKNRGKICWLIEELRATIKDERIVDQKMISLAQLFQMSKSEISQMLSDQLTRSIKL